MGRARYSAGYVVLTKAQEWQGHWFPYVRDAEGKERRTHRTQILGAKAKMRKFEAEDALRKLTRPLAEQNNTSNEDVTLKWFIDTRWKPMKVSGWQVGSTQRTNDQLLGVIEKRLGSTKLKELDKVVMQVWLDELGRTQSKSRVQQIKMFLKSICAEAVEEDRIPKDPSRLLKLPKNLRKPDGTVLEWAEYHAVLLALKERDRLIIKVAGACAVRPEELFAFRWQSLQKLPNGRSGLSIEQTVYRGVMRNGAKTEGSVDLVAVPNLLAAELEAYREECRWSKDEDYIFTNSHGGFIDKDDYLKTVLRPVRIKLGLKKFNFQVLRRTFSTRTFTEGMGTLKDIQKQLRHSKPDMTLERYIKSVPESVSAMADSFYETMIAEPKGKVQ
jgi:integrase